MFKNFVTYENDLNYKYHRIIEKGKKNTKKDRIIHIYLPVSDQGVQAFYYAHQQIKLLRNIDCYSSKGENLERNYMLNLYIDRYMYIYDWLFALRIAISPSFKASTTLQSDKSIEAFLDTVSNCNDYNWSICSMSKFNKEDIIPSPHYYEKEYIDELVFLLDHVIKFSPKIENSFLAAVYKYIILTNLNYFILDEQPESIIKMGKNTFFAQFIIEGYDLLKDRNKTISSSFSKSISITLRRGIMYQFYTAAMNFLDEMFFGPNL